MQMAVLILGQIQPLCRNPEQNIAVLCIKIKFMYLVVTRSGVLNRTSTIYYAQINGDGSLSAWQTNSKNLPSTRLAHNTVIYNGHVYLIAGQSSSLLSTVDYAAINADGSIGTFVSTTALPNPTSEHRSVVHNQQGLVAHRAVIFTTKYILRRSTPMERCLLHGSCRQTLCRKRTEVFLYFKDDGFFYILGGYNSSTIFNKYFAQLSWMRIH